MQGLVVEKRNDYAKAGLSFTDDYAVVELGVGKNMVASIRYWLRLSASLTTMVCRPR